MNITSLHFCLTNFSALISKASKIFLLVIFFAITSYAQKGYKNPEEYAKAANKLFEKGEFQKAFTFYQTLRSNNMGNADYNFRLGVCMMYSEPEKKERPIFYFELALSFNVEDNRVYYYLGRAYHNNYRFSEAKKTYEKYKSLAKGRLVKSFDIDRRIQECENGINLLSSINLLYVIDKQLVKSKTFYKSYDIPGSGAKIVAIPLDLRTKYDEKHKAPPFGLFFPKGKMFYYASYGSNGKNGLDIYRSHHGDDGEWSKTENLGSQINTPYDDAYPYVTLDGRTLYFSSKGHNSMGGYDVFKSTFNLNSVSWGEPENLNFPINTPFDDIFYVPDSNITLAHFSSDRQSLEGRIYVYYVGISKKEQQQDLAKVFRDGGDATNITKLLKDIAELKTNINVDEYKREEKKIKAKAENIIAVNDSAKVKRYITKRSDLRDDESFDNIVKEGYNTYKLLQYKTAKLRRQRTTIGKIAAQNDKYVEEYTAKGDSSSLVLADQYKEAASISRDIGKKLGEQINKTEKITADVLEQAGELQKQAGLHKKDSVEFYLKNIQKLSTIVDNYKEPTKEIVEQKYAVVRAAQKEATLKKIENRTALKELNQLKADITEYEDAMKASEDAEEKQEYADMLVSMKTEVKQKTEKQAKIQAELDKLQSKANLESDKLSALNESLDQYYQVAKALEGESMSEELAKSIDSDIEGVKKKSEEYIASNSIKTDTSVIDSSKIVAANEIDKQIEEVSKNIKNDKKGVLAEPKNDFITASQLNQENKITSKTVVANLDSNTIANSKSSISDNSNTLIDSDIVQSNLTTESVVDNNKILDSNDSVNKKIDNTEFVKVSSKANAIASDTSTIAMNDNDNGVENKNISEAQAAAALINKSHGKIPEKQKENKVIANPESSVIIANRGLSDLDSSKKIKNNNEELNNISSADSNSITKKPIEFASIGKTKKSSNTSDISISKNNINNNSTEVKTGVNSKSNLAVSTGIIAANSNTKGANKELGDTISKKSEIASVDMQTFTSEIKNIKHDATVKSDRLKGVIQNNNDTINELESFAINQFKKSEELKAKAKQLENGNNDNITEGVTLKTLSSQADEAQLLAKVAYKKAAKLKLKNNDYKQNIDDLTVINKNADKLLSSSQTVVNSKDLMIQKESISAKLDSIQYIVDNKATEDNNEILGKNQEDLMIVKQELKNVSTAYDSLVSKKMQLASSDVDTLGLADLNNSIKVNQKKYNRLKQKEQLLNNNVNEAESEVIVMNTISSSNSLNTDDSVSQVDKTVSQEDKAVISKIAMLVETDKVANIAIASKSNTIENNNSEIENNDNLSNGINNNNSYLRSELNTTRSSELVINDPEIEMPSYHGDSTKEELAKQYLEPSYKALEKIQKRSNSNKLQMAKSIGIEIRYSQLAHNLSRDIASINDKILNSADESLKNTYKIELEDKKAQYIALKRKESAAALYVGVLKQEQEDLNKEYSKIKNEFIANKELLDGGTDSIVLTNVASQNVNNIENAEKREDIYLNKLADNNKRNESEIVKIENNISLENFNYAKLMQKLDLKTSNLDEETKDSKKNKLEIEISQLESQAQQSRFIVNNYKKEKSNLEASIQKNNNIIEAVNNHILSLESVSTNDIAVVTENEIKNTIAKKDSVKTDIFAPESRIDSDKILGLNTNDTTKSHKLPYYNDNSIDFVYFDKTDIAQHKKLLLLAQVELINKQIDILAQQSLNTVSVNEKAKINEEMKGLKKERDDVQTKIYNLDAFIVSSGGSTTSKNNYSSKELISRINLQKDKFTMATILLRDTAQYFNSEEKKKILDLADDLERKTNQLNLAVIEINQIDNINKYRESLIVLANIKNSMANSQIANSLQSKIDEAKLNNQLAEQSRKSSQNKDISLIEKEQLNKQSVEYQSIAVNIMHKAIRDYGNENDIAMISEKANPIAIEDNSRNIAIESASNNIVVSADTSNTNQSFILSENKIQIEPKTTITNDSLNAINSNLVKVAQNENINAKKESQVNISDNKEISNGTSLIDTLNSSSIAVNANSGNSKIETQVLVNNNTENNIDINIKKINDSPNNKIVTENTNSLNDSPNNKTITENTNLLNDSHNNKVDKKYDNSNSVDLVYSNINFNEISLDKLATIDEAKLPKNKIEEYKIRKADMLGIYVGNSKRGQSNMSFYNTKESIFINPPLPNGLVFKVQIAAFRKPIPANTFGDIKPINGETAPNSAFTRYMAGLFTNYNDANQSKNIIRTKGYTDAFVVAYFNGRRISVRQARAMIANGTAYTDSQLLAVANKLKVDNYGKSKAADATSSAYTGVPIDKALKTNTGLVYTVQIGVFRGVRSSQRLANAPDIFYNITTKGYHRYFSGKYNDRNTAINARNQIRANGINDAFVIVFNDGKRISTAQARIIEQQTTNNQQPTTNNQATTNNIIFKVQLGAFRTNRVGAQLRELEKLSDNGLDTYKVGNLVKYTTQGYASYTDALNARNRIRTIGPKDVFVIALKNGVRISLKDARAELGQ